MVEPIISDRYQVRRHLGKKAGRQTLLAIDLTTDQPVVLKLLTFSPDFGWDDLKLFEREIAALQHLSHPCIPRYLNHFELDLPSSKGFVLVQSYVDGRSLEDYFKLGRTFREAEVKQLAHALLNILTYLHEQHPPVIHRDIKPSNILLTRSANAIGQVYLVDFGSVQTLAAREGGTMTIVGTYGYMPPEQFGGRTSPASDLYSLGATLVYLVTGHHPSDIPQTQLRLQFEPLASLSPELLKWLGRMVEPGLNERFTSATQALRVLLQPSTSAFNSAALTSKRSSQPVVEKPEQSNILLLKRPSWIDILIPQVAIHSNSQPAYTRLYIDHQQISLISSLSHDLPPSMRVAIVGLEHHSHDPATGSVKILTTRHTYTLGGDGSLSPAELNWLAYELSEWLNLPILRS